MNKNFMNFTALAQVLLLTTSTGFASQSYEDDSSEYKGSKRQRPVFIDLSPDLTKVRKKSVVAPKKSKAVSKKRNNAEQEESRAHVPGLEPVVKRAAMPQEWKVLDIKEITKNLASHRKSHIDLEQQPENLLASGLAFLNWVDTGELRVASEVNVKKQRKRRAAKNEANPAHATVISIGDTQYDYADPCFSKDIRFKTSGSLLQELEVLESDEKTTKLTQAEKDQVAKVFDSVPLKAGQGGQYAAGLLCLQLKKEAKKDIEITESVIKEGEIFNFYIYKKDGDAARTILFVDSSNGDVQELKSFLSKYYPYKPSFHLWWEEVAAVPVQQEVSYQEEGVVPPKDKEEADAQSAAPVNFNIDLDLQEFAEPPQLEEWNNNFEAFFEDPHTPVFMEELDVESLPSKKRGRVASFLDFSVHPDSSDGNKKGRTIDLVSSDEQDNMDPSKLLSLIEEQAEKARDGDEDAVKWLQKAADNNSAEAQYRLGEYYANDLHKAVNRNEPTTKINRIFNKANKYLTAANKQNHEQAFQALLDLLCESNKYDAAIRLLDNTKGEVEIQRKLVFVLVDSCLQIIDSLSSQSGTRDADRLVKKMKEQLKRAESLIFDLSMLHKEIPTEKIDAVRYYLAHGVRQSVVNSPVISGQSFEMFPLRKRSSSSEMVIEADQAAPSPAVVVSVLEQIHANQKIAEEDDDNDRREAAAGWLEVKANEGSPDAAFALGHLYYNQLKELLKEEYEKETAIALKQAAVDWLDVAMGLGHAQAKALLDQMRVEEENQPAPARASSPVQEQSAAEVPSVNTLANMSEINTSDETNDTVKAALKAVDPRACLKKAAKLLSNLKNQNDCDEGLRLLKAVITEYADKNGQYANDVRFNLKKQAAALYLSIHLKLASSQGDLENNVLLLEAVASGILIEEIDPSNLLGLDHFKNDAQNILSSAYASNGFFELAKKCLQAGKAAQNPEQIHKAMAYLRKASDRLSMDAIKLLFDEYMSQGEAGYAQAWDLWMNTYQQVNSAEHKRILLTKALSRASQLQSNFLALSPSSIDADACVLIGEKLLTIKECRSRGIEFLIYAADQGETKAVLSLFDVFKSEGKSSYFKAYQLLLTALSSLQKYDEKQLCTKALEMLKGLGNEYQSNQPTLLDYTNAIACYEAAHKCALKLGHSLTMTDISTKLAYVYYQHAQVCFRGKPTVEQAQAAVDNLLKAKSIISIKGIDQILSEQAYKLGEYLSRLKRLNLIPQVERYLTVSANLNNGAACRDLGNLYFDPNLGLLDLHKAKKYMKKAVELNIPKAAEEMVIIDKAILKEKCEKAATLALNINSSADLEESKSILLGLYHGKDQSNASQVKGWLGNVYDALGDLKWNEGIDHRSAIYLYVEAVKYDGETSARGKDRAQALLYKRYQLGLYYLYGTNGVELDLDNADMQFSQIEPSDLDELTAAEFNKHSNELKRRLAERTASLRQNRGGQALSANSK